MYTYSFNVIITFETASQQNRSEKNIWLYELFVEVYGLCCKYKSNLPVSGPKHSS